MIDPSNEWQAYAYEMGFQHGSDAKIRRADPTGILPGADRFYRIGYKTAVAK